jgi:hypothetical protein
MMKKTKKNATSARSKKPVREARSPSGDSDKKQSPKVKERALLASPRATSKLAQVITMLRTAKGATIEELARATDWQTHSVRGAISGALKKKFGLKVTSEKADGVRTYRIAD